MFTEFLPGVLFGALVVSFAVLILYAMNSRFAPLLKMTVRLTGDDGLQANDFDVWLPIIPPTGAVWDFTVTIDGVARPRKAIIGNVTFAATDHPRRRKPIVVHCKLVPEEK